VTGLVAKEPKVRKRVGLIATLPMDQAGTNLVVDLMERREASTRHVDQPRVHAKKKVKASLGVRKQKKERNNELNRN